MRALLGVLLPFGAMLIVLWRTHARDCGLGVCLSAACAFGLGASSLGWWALLHLQGPSTKTLGAVDLAVWTVVVLALWFTFPRASGPPCDRTTGVPSIASGIDPARVGGRNPSWWRRVPDWSVALAVFLPLCAFAVVSFAASSAIVPHGSWDAWAIWNARARFLSLGYPDWHDGFLAPASHPDYPLLLPVSVARMWALAGHHGVSVPIALAALFATLVVLLAGAAIWRESGPARGLLAAAFVLANPTFAGWAPAQVADVPLSLYMLLALVFMTAAMRRPDALSLWAFCGMSAGLAAWTKNEGLAFAIVIVLVAAYYAGRSPGRRARLASLSALMAGAAPALFVVVRFKFTLAYNDLIGRQSVDRILENISNHDRISLVLGSVAREIWFGGAALIGILPLLAVYVASSGVSRQRMAEVRPALVTLAIMLAIYMMVYVLTPFPLQWHLTTSLGRLVLHLTPSVIWVGLTVVTPTAPGSRATASPVPRPTDPAVQTSTRLRRSADSRSPSLVCATDTTLFALPFTVKPTTTIVPSAQPSRIDFDGAAVRSFTPSLSSQRRRTRGCDHASNSAPTGTL